MSNKTDNPALAKAEPLKNMAEERVKNEESSRWILLKAEEYNEKFKLSHATIGIFAGMTVWERISNYKQLLKQYFTQLSEIEREFEHAEQALKMELQSQNSEDQQVKR
jgi:hypothetical protein